MIPGVFAADGCGEGTVLVDGVCQLAPEESNDGCGEGTVLVDGVCQLDKSSVTSIPSLYICLLYTSPSPRDATLSRMPSSA